MHARILIEVNVDQDFPSLIECENERNVQMKQEIHYEWKPMKCTKCHGFGHALNECKKEEKQNKVLKPAWIPNKKKGRQELWKDIRSVASDSQPWIIQGDFNALMCIEDRIGQSVRTREIVDMRTCMEDCHVRELKASGQFYTWNNKQEGLDRVFCKLDRVLGNDAWLDDWPLTEVTILAEGEFDHCPLLLKSYTDHTKKKPFRFFNMWCKAESFHSTVRRICERRIDGTNMFQIVSKLKMLKQDLKQLNVTQKNLHSHPEDNTLRATEKEVREAYNLAHRNYVSFLSQKAKIRWIQEGDDNTKTFHQNFYKNLLGNKNDTAKIEPAIVAKGHVLTIDQQEALNLRFTGDDIKKALFSIPYDKAPGLDGYSSYFFKQSWDTVGTSVIEAIQDFFRSGKILREVNVIAITLIPKVKTPAAVGDFRPITCCSVIYKTITKLIYSELGKILPDLVSQTQGAFISGRSIIRNILLCQDLVKRFNRSNNQVKGLRANNNKSALYHTAMEDREITRIEQFSGFVKDELPFRHFLWSGEAESDKAGHIRWELVCSSKKYGELGFRNIKLWNKAVGKLVWHIGSNKDDLWVKWIHTIYIKHHNWWTFKAPAGASWIVKHICKVKDDSREVGMQNWAPNQQYSISKVYNQMVGEHPTVPWVKGYKATDRNFELAWCTVSGEEFDTMAELDQAFI
ncbi:uncharacterized protein LOC125498714 [Beta vulgaris subsp. vulgaris]|uniref:uncharacterized protein LOC125498714 n=1 Tax=Beta vulgaris subsp. vulgaris TaxID=3555 RepID=UPI0025487DA8|nr:uncharacterized protein LOC125498714 [Beta vulgaris subsp. vulgaris]